jgi:DNA-binding LacI/PurR family transcriptional regulator
MRKYTISEFAKLCGTSPATVSRVLNNPGLVSAPLRTIVEMKMKETGYKPNPFASRLGSKSKWGLALLLFDILNPFFALLVRQISHLAMEQGIPLTVCDTEGNLEKEKVYLDYLLDNKIAGILLSEGISISTIERARKNSKVVLIDRHFNQGRISEVSSDNYSGGRQATDYLLQLNHRRIGFIAGPDNWLSAEERLRGYKDALESHGVPFRFDMLYKGDLRFESGISALEYFLSLPKRPTAIFSANDQMAYGVLYRAKELYIDIPQDISLVGFDDIPFHSFFRGNLTTIKQDIPALCTKAFSIIMGKLGNNGAMGTEKRVLIPTSLKIGDSCIELAPEAAPLARGMP